MGEHPHPLSERPIKVVIKGLPIDTTAEEIEEELALKGYRIFKVHQLTQRVTKKSLPIFQVQVLKTDNINEICTEKSLLYFTLS